MSPQNTPLQKQPPASRHQLVGVLKLSGQAECESRRTSPPVAGPPVSGHEASGSSRVKLTACELELRKRASRATLEVNGRDFRAGAAEVYEV